LYYLCIAIKKGDLIMWLSEEQRKRMQDEFDARMANNKIIYPSDIERSKSPREFGRIAKNHKRNNNKRRK
jgi:hypothetical protein